jgi:hypothetical protein
MRHKRKLHKDRLITELAELCCQIPNDSIQVMGKATHFMDEGVVSGKRQLMPIIFLKNCSISKISRLIRIKKTIISGLALSNMLKNWIK